MPLLRNRLVPIAPPRLIMMIWLLVRSLCRPLSRATIEVSSKRRLPQGLTLCASEAIASQPVDPEDRLDLIAGNAPDNGLNDFHVLDILGIDLVQIVRQHDIIRQLARRDGAFEIFLAGVVGAIGAGG